MQMVRLPPAYVIRPNNSILEATITYILKLRINNDYRLIAASSGKNSLQN
jgi:hypothetical protein